MASPSLIVHHLQNGQGERIPWLLEELNIPYDLRLYQRAPLLSPPELKAKYPTGARSRGSYRFQQPNHHGGVWCNL
jgi:glutathione S-transferase